MKAVFVTRGCLMRGSNVEATMSAMRSLAQSGLYTILLGTGPDDGQPTDGALNQQLVERITAGGGRIDATTHCPHGAGQNCYCWGAHPGFLWQASRDLDLRLDESYTLCDSPTDVSLAYMAGCRPILVLHGRSIESLYEGHQPDPTDFPIARDLTRAIDYILCEESTAAELGYPRPPSAYAALEEGESTIAFPDNVPPQALPILTAFTSPILAKGTRPAQIIRYGGRWLVLFIIGGVWLSLGIAYLLTHLYRVRPFPEFVWYLTLQFIPRPVRGGLFILTGVLVLLVALRSVREMFPTAIRWGKDQNR